MKNQSEPIRAFIFIAFIFSIFFISSCKKEESAPPAPPLRTYADLENDFDAIDISDGIVDVSLKASSFLTWDVRIISPGIVEGESYPLIFTLHGAANGSPTAHQATACLAEPGLEALGAIIISPNGYFYQWYDGPNIQQVLTLVNLAKKYWPVDTTKIALTGFSNGGNGSWFFAETHPEIFSAAIPMATSYNTYNTDSIGRFIETPLYVIHGENDELFPLEDTQLWVDVTQAVGTNVTLVVAPGLGHYEPCEYVDYLQDASQWLINDIWQ
jgi:predicted peptidase